MDIMFFGAHPDDVEIGCSGTILKYVAMGKKICIVDLTRGELGTRGNADTRLEESEAASKVLGIAARVPIPSTETRTVELNNIPLGCATICLWFADPTNSR
jgi:LmbE family N-acetylglucosaminyl deacetylase